MIDAFLRSTIGTWGNAALDFYIANSLWINGLFLLYALLVVLSRRNYNRNLNQILGYLKEKYGSQLDKKGSGSLVSMIKKSNIPWAETLKHSKMPFLTPPGSIRLYLSNVNNLQRFLTFEKIAALLKTE